MYIKNLISSESNKVIIALNTPENSTICWEKYKPFNIFFWIYKGDNFLLQLTISIPSWKIVDN